MQLIAYSILYDEYFDLSNLILTEIVLKLGNKESRTNKIYLARFIMLAINHLVGEVILDREDDKLNCWNQSKRVFQDLVRINMNSSSKLTYPPLIKYSFQLFLLLLSLKMVCLQLLWRVQSNILLPKQQNPPKPNLNQPPHQSLKIQVFQKQQEPKMWGV